MVNFENTVIVMTSNAGSQFRENLMGFGKSDAQLPGTRRPRPLADFLRPEFISRVDEIVYFSPLKEEDFRRIAGLMLGELKQPLSERGIAFSWTEEAAALSRSSVRRQAGRPVTCGMPSAARWRTRSPL